MLNQIWNFLTPPHFPDDEDKTRKARYAHVIALGLFTVDIIYEILVRRSAGSAGVSLFEFILIAFAVACLGGIWLLKRGYVRQISFLLVALIWLTSNGFAATSYGARDASYIVNFAIVLMAGLLLGWQFSWIITFSSAISGIALAFAEQNGYIKVTEYPVLDFARDVSLIFLLNGVLIYLLINGLENALRRSRTNFKELEAANASLNYTQTELTSRSADLLTANNQLENRTRKL